MKSLYDPDVALKFFKSAGWRENFAQGATIFAEDEKARPILLQREKMYYLLEGEVSVVARGKLIGRVVKGEVFGELAPIAHAPRSAAAVANTACCVIALDERGFQSALVRKPVFALMLMSLMVARLRQTIAALHEEGKLTVAGAWRNAVVFDRRRLADLVQGLAGDPQIFYDRGAMVIKEGALGARMYAVLEGRVAVSIQGSVVERVGPGGVFGEASLLDQSTRMASVQAETDCTLQPVGRTAFLELVKVSPVFAGRMLSALAQRLRLLTARLK